MLGVIKSPTGKFWWVVNTNAPGKPFAVRDTKWEASAVMQRLKRLGTHWGAKV